MNSFASTPPIVDFHAHAFPDRLKPLFNNSEGMTGKLKKFRQSARTWLRPFSSVIQYAQPSIRHIPGLARKAIEELGGLAVLPNLLFESTLDDLTHCMDEAGVDSAVLIAHPPMIPNDFILEAASQNRRFIPVVNIPPKTHRPGECFKVFAAKGAKALKIHPAADGEGVDSPRYRALLTQAADLGVPVIIHTGCFHSHLFFKSPSESRVERFAPWFEKYSTLPFVLAHMNVHDPHIALDLTEEYPNLYVDTSWQPAEIIGEAVRRVGSERVLFATDWPIGGGNLCIGVEKIRECLQAGTFQQRDAQLILGENAVKLLKL